MRFDNRIEELLQELEELCENGRFPNIDRRTAEFIYDLIVSNNLQNVLEIGACNGYSTIWLALAVKKIGGNVITIEWGKDKFKWLQENLNRSGLGEFIDAINDNALNVIEEIDGKLDFVFIDAMAKQYLDYFKKIENKLSDNAIIVADNVVSHKEKMQDFINYVKMNTDYESGILNIGKGVMIIKLK